MATVVCRTEDCGNAGVPIPLDLEWTDDEGVVHDVDSVVCGVCGEPIGDVVK